MKTSKAPLSLPAVLVLAIAGCATPPPGGAAVSAAAADPAVEAKELDELVEAFFEDSLQRNPVQATFIGDKRYNYTLPNFFSVAYRSGDRAFQRYWHDQVTRAVDRDALAGQSRLTYDVFVAQREDAIAEEAFAGHLLPLSQFFSIPNFLAQFGSGKSAQPFRTVEDYEAWLMRARALVPLYDQMIVNMREGMKEGVVQPKVLMQKVLPQLAAHAVDDVDQSIFMMPTKSYPESFSKEDKARLDAAYRELVASSVLPAYKRLYEFVKDEYLPACRDTHGYWAHPNGDAWYALRVRQSTTTDMTPDEIHDIGQAEVKRIHEQMKKVMKQVGFEGTLEAFFEYAKTDAKFYYTDEAALLDGYRALQAKVNERLPKLFDVMPKSDYEVRAVEKFRAESSAGASYMRAAPDGSRPGIFYVNTFNLKSQPKFEMETLSLHEASPGHHFQVAIAQEVETLPRFRRFGGYTAYAEGWALYAESLGRELGMFEDPMSYYGMLSAELLRAMRLVVDTGMHRKKWTREQAIAFMKTNSSMAESDVISEVERYLAIPGQALAYKVGQLAIRKMRTDAEAALGPKFDVKAFHREVLIDGALPLSVLERKIEEWVARVKAS